MHFIEQHKAIIITALLAGILVLGMFSIQLKQQQNHVTEHYYALEPEPEKMEEVFQNTQDGVAPPSDKAYNEDQSYKDMMRNFKAVDTDDFERTTKALESAKLLESETTAETETTMISTNTNGKYTLKSEETKAYKKLQKELKKRLENKKQADAHAKTKSSLTYSLKGRVLQSYKTPRYLCENGGKIVVAIKVNAMGEVYESYINGASSSNNPCLTQHAIEYANSVRFNSSERTDQLGTITFVFKGKN